MIYELIKNTVKSNPNHTCIQTDSKQISYGELDKYSYGFASTLLADGVKQECRVLIFLPNTPEFIISLIALNLIGAVAVLIDTKYNHELCDILLSNSITHIITDEEGSIKLSGIQNEIHRQFIIYNINTEKIFYNTSDVKFSKCENMDSLAVIIYTSGSTNKPKGVLNSNRTLEEALRNYTSTVPFCQQDVFLGVTPFYHSYALGSCLLSALFTGATLILQRQFIPPKILKLLMQEKVTVFHGVPYMYQLLNEQLQKKKVTLPSLKLCVSAGSPLSETISRTFYELTNKIIHQEYGSSETGTIAINLSDNLNKNITSVGRPLHRILTKIVSDKFENVGSLYVKSKGHSIGYIDYPPFERELYKTSDIVELDAEGYITILGRDDRMINVSGLKVNPYEVESILQKHPLVLDVRVCGKKHEEFGEIVEAYIVTDDATLSARELMIFCEKQLAAYKVPKNIIFTKQIHKSGTGKHLA